MCKLLNENQNYEIVFSQNKNVINPGDNSLTRTITQTIHYVYSNGQTAAKDVVQTITFTRSASMDPSTGKIVYSAWKTTTNPAEFPSVASPVIAGYTPNESESKIIPVTADSANSVQTIVYNANEEQATIEYIDNGNHKIMSKQVLSGPYGSTSPYNPASVINSYENQGYRLLSDDYPAGGVIFDHDNQVFKIVFTRKDNFDPNDKTAGLTKTITQTIYYIYNNGSQAAAPVNKQMVFNRKAVYNAETGKTTYTAWHLVGNIDDFPSVKSPVINGYTPSQVETASIDNVTIDTENNVQTIVYSPTQETATVKYIDDNTGKVLQTQTLTGPYGTTSDYKTQPTIDNYEDEGYQLVSNNYPTDGVVFDTNNNQIFEVHLKDKIINYTPTDNPEKLDLSNTVTQTIKYVYSNGSQAAPTKTTQVTFTRDATKDNVTGTITYGNWTQASQEFPAVTSPVVTGYTPSATASSAVNVTATSENNEQTITYTPNAEHAHNETHEQKNNINNISISKDKNGKKINRALVNSENYVNSNNESSVPGKIPLITNSKKKALNKPKK